MRPSLDQYFTDMLATVSSRATCPRRKVAAIITDVHGHVLSMGYNGVPSGIPHCTDFPCPGVEDEPGNSSRCYAVHGEANAILQCTRIDLAYKIYCSCTPCFECAKLILNTPIVEIVCAERYSNLDGENLLNEGKRVVKYRAT